ncbi:MAG: fumarylacetoacetase [Betaproteobacteria bacterium]|nr:fumarylacetoacetase [Betaproteobacteria bacterium]
MLNDTHQASLRSWVDSANDAECEFPIQNLPYGAFRRKGSRDDPTIGVAIGEQILPVASLLGLTDLSAIAREAAAACDSPTLNRLMALGPRHWSALRQALSQGLRQGSPHQAHLAPSLVPITTAEFAVPAQIGDFTDMYTSLDHALNVGRLFRPDNPLMPNFKWLPCGYHARVSSIGVSGQRFVRPKGQVMPAGESTPIVTATRRLDYELELAIWIGTGNTLGEPISLDEASQHVFGLGLLNDWSARDIQAWEYQPLGPLLSKNFATTVSPWVVTMEALEPFLSPWQRASDDPQPVPYLESTLNRERGAIDIGLEAWLHTAAMAREGKTAHRLSATNFRHNYWTVAQMIAHHTVNGCNLCSGDLIGSGTQSGPGPGESGALIELTQGGKRPITLPGGEERTFLADGDTVILRARAERKGFRSIGFGECAGTVLPARG